MQTRRLGRTGHQSSLAVLGGVVFHFLDEDAAGQLLHQALDAGVNHLDIAPGYYTAEQTVGVHIPAVRDRLFISEKSAETTKDGVRRDLEQTLLHLGVDTVDLYQLHAVQTIEELDSRSGAVEALESARDEGLCRWIGITGHGLATAAAQREAVHRYDLDTVMLPVYPALWANPRYREAAQELLEAAVQRDLGVMAIKAGAARAWPASQPPEERSATTWYEPHTTRDGLARGIRFALSTPGVTAFCTPGDAALLPIALEIAAEYEPLPQAESDAAVSTAHVEPGLFPAPI